MPVVTTAQLAQTLTLLLKKDTCRLEATISAFSTSFAATDRYAVLCCVTAHLQVCTTFRPACRQNDVSVLHELPYLREVPKWCHACHLWGTDVCATRFQVGRSLLNAEERLAAFFLFRALYPEQDISSNPFVAYLIEVCSI